MTKGPQKYPGASTAYWYQDTFGGDSMESNVIVWHSTEGTSLPGYNGGTQAPNLTAKPDFTAKKLLWYQHFDFDVSSRALVHAGAVATNTLNVCQVEIVGTCDPATHAKWAKQGIQHLYMAELPDWAIRDLAAFAAWAHSAHGVPLTSGVTFKAYPASYGTGNGVRMTDSQWLTFKGHCGHQHVPSGNVHGDPGAFPMTAILSRAKGSGTEEEAVALTDDDIKKIFQADGTVYAARPPVGNDDYETNKYWTAAYAFQTTVEGVRKAQQQIGTLSAQIGALSAAVAALAGSGGITAAELEAAAVAGAKAALEQLGDVLKQED